jgi:transcriptional regulator with GAF, ATPase, and Fis domain
VKIEQTQETAASSVGPLVSPDGAVLEVVSGTATGTSVTIPGRDGGVLRIGKARDNDIVLPDSTVSRYHLELVRTEHGLLARDLESRNGTFIGGARIREAIVEPGMLIVAGEVNLLLRIDIAGAVVPPSPSTRFQLALGRSLAMRRLFGLLERVAPKDASILLIGETGTGKDVIARSIHAASARNRGPFEVVDCGAIAANLVESELFGHEKGAFTGAIAASSGAFERAHGGTVFLDEIGELPLELQPRLLRVLESRQIRRLGGKKWVDVDVRIVAATTRDVKEEVRAGRFRSDLYFRLAVVTAAVPPLRERTEDIPVIAESMLASFGANVTIDPTALAQLRSYAWPGNVRELRNVLERSSVFAQAAGLTTLTEFDLEQVREPTADGPIYDFTDGTSYRDARTRAELNFERQFVTWILAQHGGNIAAAARTAKMDRKYLGDLVRKHKLSGSSRD